MRYAVHRVLEAIVSLLLIAVLVFFLATVIGDPVLQLLPPTYSEEEYQALRKALGYDQPALVRFGAFLLDIAQGNLGNSVTYQRPVIEVIASRLPVTLTLATLAMAIGFLLAVSTGFAAGYARRRRWDDLITTFSTFGVAIPNFAVGLLAIIVFAVVLKWLPAGGWGGVAELVLPVAVLSFYVWAIVVRIARSAMRDQSASAFVELARSKGLSESKIFFSHTVRPSLPPVLTYASVIAGGLFSGAVVTETLFGVPGVGRLVVESVQSRDQPLVVGVVLFSAFVFVVLNLVSDLLTIVIDPRVKFDGKR